MLRRFKSCVSVILVIMVLFTIALAGCGNKQTNKSGNTTEQTSSNKSNRPGEITYKGKITFYAQAYAPVAPTKDNPNPPTKFKEVAEQYHKLHPNITIEFVPNPQGQDYYTWVKTKAAGGQLPDIVWYQVQDINQLPKGMFTNLKPYFQEPNPYVKGNKKWEDLFNKIVLEQDQAPDGGQYVVNGDYVTTMILYNKEMFTKAGITEVPKTWDDLIEDCKKLKAAGFTPMGGDASINNLYATWFARYFLSNFYANDLQKLDVGDGTHGTSILARVVAVKKGYFSKKDPRWSAWLPMMKEFSKYWQKGFATPPQGGLVRLFVNKQIAMYEDGTWAIKNVKDLKINFDWGTFPLPQLTSKSSKYANDNVDTSNAAGGPFAAFQYAVSTPKSDNSMTDEKLKAVIDWLKFITTPENNEAVVNNLGVFVPTIKGTKPVKELEWLTEKLKTPLIMVDGAYNGLTNSHLQQINRNFQMYLNNQQNLNATINALDTATQNAADELIRQHPEWNVNKYLK